MIFSLHSEPRFDFIWDVKGYNENLISLTNNEMMNILVKK